MLLFFSRFNVGHEAPPNAITEAPDIADFAGPKFDAEGRIIPHSILGDVDDFLKEAYKRGKKEDVVVVVDIVVVVVVVVVVIVVNEIVIDLLLCS